MHSIATKDKLLVVLSRSINYEYLHRTLSLVGLTMKSHEIFHRILWPIRQLVGSTAAATQRGCLSRRPHHCRRWAQPPPLTPPLPASRRPQPA